MLLEKLIKKHNWLVRCSIGMCGITTVVTLWWNSILSSIITNVSDGKQLSVKNLLASLAAIILTSVSAYAKTLLCSYTCEQMGHSLRMGYARYLSCLPFSQAEHLSRGEQFSKLQNELSDILNYFNSSLFPLVDDAIRFLITLFWLLKRNAWLTILSNLPVFFIVLYIIWSSKVIGSATKGSQIAKGTMNQYADSLISLFPIIRLYDASKMLLNGYNTACKEWEEKTSKAEKVRARLMSLSGLLTSIPLMLLFLIGGRQVINGVITIGTLYVFLNLSGNVSGIMMNMPGHIAAFRQFLANIQRISPNVMLKKKEGAYEHTY
ncbi:MAG: ABC transporter ATP-binding protein [Lachnospiraceae bacterium]|nr:ABC transporter ATP-binding protein [Lachnospiraceae bacterium]